MRERAKLETSAQCQEPARARWACPPRAFYLSIIAVFTVIPSGSLCGRESQHKKGFSLTLVWKVRLFETREWPIWSSPPIITNEGKMERRLAWSRRPSFRHWKVQPTIVLRRCQRECCQKALGFIMKTATLRCIPPFSTLVWHGHGIIVTWNTLKKRH